jgi:AraC-like DNA-binding protein
MTRNGEGTIMRFRRPAVVAHPRFEGFETLGRLVENPLPPRTVELSSLKIIFHSVDYLHAPSPAQPSSLPPLRLHQDCYRLWYQLGGSGILQNVTRNTFGAARPGLLGVMEQCERHVYLHQRDTFECFTLEFSLLPSHNSRCWWNSETEGKAVLGDNQRQDLENIIFGLIDSFDEKRNTWGIATTARLLDLLAFAVAMGLIVIEEAQFPKNKARSLAAKAKHFMKRHYGLRHTQSSLEKECGVDINYLNIIFKKETGGTLYRYLTDIRMEQAKYLLEKGDLPVGDIGTKVGYPNNNSFTRAFGKFTGMRPTEYRRKSVQACGRA